MNIRMGQIELNHKFLSLRVERQREIALLLHVWRKGDDELMVSSRGRVWLMRIDSQNKRDKLEAMLA